MKRIKIYVEGGGDSVHQRRELRTGFDVLLASQKSAAQMKRLHWDTVFHGGRQQAFDAFKAAVRNAGRDDLLVLLVDSEDPVPAVTNDKAADAETRAQFLGRRDAWDVSDVPPEQVHLMVQCMEAWIVADPDALSNHYGKGFRPRSLPKRHNLEDEHKLDVYAKLKKATEKTQKGAYAKIRHASKLLALVDPKKIAERCPRFNTFTSWLDERISDA